jgi:hypothetical protein
VCRQRRPANLHVPSNLLATRVRGLAACNPIPILQCYFHAEEPVPFSLRLAAPLPPKPELHSQHLAGNWQQLYCHRLAWPGHSLSRHGAYLRFDAIHAAEPAPSTIARTVTKVYGKQKKAALAFRLIEWLS